MLAEVAKLPKPEIENMLKKIDNLRKMVLEGNFESIWVIAWTYDHKLLSSECGTPKGKIYKIGALECFKQDLINSMETDEPTGL